MRWFAFIVESQDIKFQTVLLSKRKKAVKPDGLISTSNVNSSPVPFNKQVKCMEITEMENGKNSTDFAPFLTEGGVSSEILGQGNHFCWKDFCL